MLFFRFQGTKSIEYESWYIDLIQLYNDLYFIDDYDSLYKEYEHTLSLRKNIEPRILFNKVLNAPDEDEVYKLAHKYKMDGVFAYNGDVIMKLRKINTVHELIKYIQNNRIKFTGYKSKDRMVQNDKYLIIFDGDLIEDFIHYGCLVKMKNIKEIIEK